MRHDHLHALLGAQAHQTPDALALLAPGQRPLTYAGLLALVEATVARLNALGLGRGDRVALVLPNGPELAAAFLGTAAGATCAPLNPAYTADECDFYLPDLKVRALIVEPGGASPAAAVARSRGIAVIELERHLDAPAGTFSLHGQSQPLRGPGGPAQPEDIALLLHTSGTTARPKRAPRTHLSLLAAARDYHPVLDLTPADRCLNILPLYHIQSLLSALLAPLSGGASVVVTPGFSAAHFFDWLFEYQPTWFTAGPVLLQTILDLARAQGVALPVPGLRAIRSGAAPLSAALLADLERFFQVPVVEGYGLSEVVPIASNPMPPRRRKFGSIGVPAGPEVAIMRLDPGSGALVRQPPGHTGEIVVRGPSVMGAYDDDPAANAQAFVDGWFRTGDEGYCDTDGYLFLTGRLKEMINYGGEKVVPAEVEAVLLAHPQVAEAAVFALPHAVFGEAVAAAVVLRPGAAFDAPALRRLAAARLAAFKVPQRIFAVEALPRGPTGKLQRLRLAEQFKLTEAAAPTRPAHVPPVDDFERRLAQVWSSLLGGTRVGRHDNFFDLGAHSLLVSGFLTQLEAEVGRPLPASVLVNAPTVAQLAATLRQPAPAAFPECVVGLQPRGHRPPFFCVHAVGGEALRFTGLARLLGDDQPFYALEAVGLHDDQPPHATVEAMAAHYLVAVRQVQPHGPYYLGGYCFGGVVAFEMARQLAALGERTALVAVFDGHAPPRTRSRQPRWNREQLGFFVDQLPGWLEEIRALGPSYLWRRTRHIAAQLPRRVAVRLSWLPPIEDSVDGAEALPARHWAVLQAHLAAARVYRPREPYAGRVTLMNVRHQSLLLDPDPRRGWHRLALGGVSIHRITGSHDTLLEAPHVAVLARALRASLDDALAQTAPGPVFEPTPELQPA